MNSSELSKRLSERALDVCLHLYPNGRQEGFLFKVGSVNGDNGKSLQVNIGGQWLGKWRDWADESFHGDLLDLWAAAKSVNPPTARREAMDFLGISLPAPMKVYANPPACIGSKEPAPSGKVMLYLTSERKLEPSIVNRFKVEVKEDTKEIVYPCYDIKGRLINRSYCKLERDENGKKKVRQDKNCAPCLFGWQSFSDEDWRKGYVVICEGQIDAMSWRQWGHPALSIPNGSGMTWIDYNFEELEAFEKLYISFDMDGKVDGQAVSNRLGAARTAFVSLPHKDANDCLKASLGPTDAQQWLDKAETIKPPHIMTAIDLKGPFLRRMRGEFNNEGFASSLFKFRSRDQFRFRSGEVTLWVGISNHGKSTFLRFLFSRMLIGDLPVAIASLEVLPEKTMEGLFLATKGSGNITDEEWVQAVGDLVVFFTKVGSTSEKDLSEAIEYCARRYAVKHFMIDSLMRVEGLEEDYPRQGEFMNRMQKIAKDTGIHIHLVVHQRKGAEDAEPEPDAIKGSSLLRNNADNIIFVQRNIEKRNAIRDGRVSEEDAEKMHDAVLSLEKDRETGFFGKTFLKYDKLTERFFAIERAFQPKVQKTADPYRGKRNGVHAD